jgi:hypothetical protein
LVWFGLVWFGLVCLGLHVVCFQNERGFAYSDYLPVGLPLSSRGL